MGALKKIGIGAGSLFAGLMIIGAIANPDVKNTSVTQTEPSPTALTTNPKAKAISTPTASKTPLPTATPTPTPAVAPKPTVVKKATPVPATPVPAASNCDPNYSNACVPIASDVDCAGGTGNGPAYVTGPVRVIGTDIYDLDRDGNGWGC